MKYCCGSMYNPDEELPTGIVEASEDVVLSGNTWVEDGISYESCSEVCSVVGSFEAICSVSKSSR